MIIYVRDLTNDIDYEVELPVDDIQDFLDENNIEEYIITGADGYSFNENESLDTINEFAQVIEDENLDDEIASTIRDNYYKLQEAIDVINNQNYMVYYDCKDMGDVAYQLLEETGGLSELPDWAQNYFDYDAYGRDLKLEGTFLEFSDGYIEIIN